MTYQATINTDKTIQSNEFNEKNMSLKKIIILFNKIIVFYITKIDRKRHRIHGSLIRKLNVFFNSSLFIHWEIANTTTVLLWYENHMLSYYYGMLLLNYENHQRGRVSRLADTELILLIAHLIRPPGSIPGVG